MTSTAFCHVMEHRGRHVVYDVHTNRLLAVDPVLAAVLPLYGPQDREQVAVDLAERFAPASVLAAVDEIETARREEGLFRPDRPRCVAPAWSAADQRALDHGQRQLTLTVSEDCNLRCRYCLHGSGLPHIRPHRPRRMALPVALAAVERFLAKSGDTTEPAISFYGGEPLLAMPVIAGVVAHVRRRHPDRRVRFCLDTNGLGLDDPDVADLIRRERLSLQVSLDGPAPVHDRHRRTVSGEPTHARIEANLTALLRGDPSLAERLLLIATLAPPYDLPAVRDYFASFPPFRHAGLDRQPMLRVNRAELDGLDLGRDAPGPSTAVDWDRQIARLRDEYLDIRGAGQAVDPFLAALFDEPLVRWRHRSSSLLGPVVGRGGCCLPGVRRQHVQVDGAVQPCERLGTGLQLGEADTGPQLDRIHELRSTFTEYCDGACSSCWSVRLCRICYDALLPGERERLPARCRAVRAGSEAVIRLFLDLHARGPQALQWLENTSVK